MENKKQLHNMALAAVLSIGLGAVSGQALAADSKAVEKCYGITKAGMNDCGGKGLSHACQGQGKVAGNPKDWMYVLKGTCDKIVGGNDKPK